MTTANEDITRRCDRCQCGDSVDCMESLCSCEVDAEGVADMTSMALRFWELKYGEANTTKS